jgi:hypothetical protein
MLADKSPSTRAKNVKVLVEGGATTLRGPVKSASEKKRSVLYCQEPKPGTGAIPGWYGHP